MIEQLPELLVTTVCSGVLLDPDSRSIVLSMQILGWTVLALLWILPASFSARASVAPVLEDSGFSDPEKVVQFKCHLDEILGDADQFESLDFTRTVTPCEGGMCLVPIDHLKTAIACRDFTISFGADSLQQAPGADSDDSDHGTYERTLDVSLWSYCGAATDPAKPQSQTISIAAESSHFQMVAEWNGFITDIKCERE